MLQHANNPVDWYPWGEAALTLAKTQNKPILLSIGYAACHWCHVMERESFENEKIAEIMNRHFICIKVDREERPDLDKVYQLSHQMLTQRPGGWPLTIALTPNGHAPFFAGTYFPPGRRHNLPGFGELVEKVSAHFKENSEKLLDYHLSFNKALTQLNPDSVGKSMPDSQQTLETAVTHLEKQFDSEFGGFGDAPKFPHPSQIELLLRAGVDLKLKCDARWLEMLKLTLDNMCSGGLFDHLGGGFFRYSVDRKWQIPHFEKMGYDNAQLISLYCDGYQLVSEQRFAEAAISTADWVISEMQQPGGGYASTLDADSEGIEGKYYVWTETDLRAVLSENEYAVVENYFGLYGEPNFEGSWHFNLNSEIDYELLENNPEIKTTIVEAKSKLFDLRNHRIRPALDNKILTAWNGLMIQGMAKAGRVLDKPEFISSAQNALDFVRNNLWQSDRMLATCISGEKARLNGYLDDYAFMLRALIELLQAKWRNEDLEFAAALCNVMLDRFEDTDNGGFYFTSHDHEPLLYRPKNGADDAIPSGNGAAIQGLIKLGNLLGESRYIESAEKALLQFADDLDRHPSVNGLMTSALQLVGDNHTHIIIRGNVEEIKLWQQYCDQYFHPGIDIYTIESGVKNLPPGLALRKSQKNAVAYVCKGSYCAPPVTSLEQLKSVFE